LESEETFENAKKATMTEVSKRGFNPREVMARLKVEIKEPFLKALLMNNIFGVCDDQRQAMRLRRASSGKLQPSHCAYNGNDRFEQCGAAVSQCF